MLRSNSAYDAFRKSELIYIEAKKKTPTPPPEQMKTLKVKAKLRGDACVNCMFSRPENISYVYCRKHQHAKMSNNWCRYYSGR